MRALIINEEVKARIAEVIAYARRNVVTPEEGQKTIQTDNAVGDEPGHVCRIPDGFRCAFSFDEVPQMGLCRHLSVSVSGDKWPHEVAVSEIAKLFGIQFDPQKPGKCAMWLEKDVRAVNLLQPEAPIL